MDEWRRAFVVSVRDRLLDDPAAIEQVDAWVRNRAPTRLLPEGLQPLWNRQLRVNAVERLNAWFRDQGLSSPTDLLQPTRDRPETHDDAVERLRALIIDSVRSMTAEELARIQLPAEAIVRGLTRRERSS
jgi:hypothetical protein